jgi:ketosteroid isomerase-like protein
MRAAVFETQFVGVVRSVALAALLAVSVCSVSQDGKKTVQTGKEEEKVKQLISRYAKAADQADPTLASRVWCDSGEDSLINPVGRWQGAERIMDFYRHDMGSTYSSRQLKITNVSVWVYTDLAWAEFSWKFSATQRKEGSSVSFHGMETQIYQKKLDSWCLVHVHYSALPDEKKAATE